LVLAEISTPPDHNLAISLDFSDAFVYSNCNFDVV